jgi:hypothetical protein
VRNIINWFTIDFLGEFSLKLLYADLFSFMLLGSPCGCPTQEDKKYATYIIKFTVQVGAENFLPPTFPKICGEPYN